MTSKVPRKEKLDEIIRSRGKDNPLICAIGFHLKVLRDSKTKDEIESREEMLSCLLSKMFIDKLEFYPTQHFKCQVNENSECWSLKPLPSELFGVEKLTEADRKFNFQVTLNRGDILDCQLAEASLQAYKLRVIHKYGITRILDDLQMMVILPLIKPEVCLLETELQPYDTIRVGVTSCEKVNDVYTVFVTVDKEHFPFNQNMPKLGRITKDDLPVYYNDTHLSRDIHLGCDDKPNTSKCSTYSDYLNIKPQFLNPYSYDKVFNLFGINSKKMCNFYPEFNNKDYPDELTGLELLRKLKISDVIIVANQVFKKLNEKQYDDSLKLVEIGLQICPKDDPLISMLYGLKSDIYSKRAKPSYSFKAFCDLEKACKLHPSEEIANKKLCHLAFKAANALYKDKKYREAALGLEMVLKYNANHSLAPKLLQHIKTKHADQFIDLEENSLTDLQEKKKKLIQKLKKMGS